MSDLLTPAELATLALSKQVAVRRLLNHCRVLDDRLRAAETVARHRPTAVMVELAYAAEAYCWAIIENGIGAKSDDETKLDFEQAVAVFREAVNITRPTDDEVSWDAQAGR